MNRTLFFTFLLGACLAHTPAWTDDRADALLVKVRERARTAQTFQAEMVATFASGSTREVFKASLRLEKPNLARISLTGMPGGEQLLVSNGSTLYHVFPQRKQYAKKKTAARGENVVSLPTPYSPESLFFNPDTVPFRGQFRLAEKAVVNGVSYQVIQATAKMQPQKRKIYVGPSGLIEGLELETVGRGAPQKTTVWLKGVVLDAPIKSDVFSYKPPAGFVAQETQGDAAQP